MKHLLNICNINGAEVEPVDMIIGGSPCQDLFAFIPYDMLIQQLSYKCENVGIRFVVTEESYTSGTSFIDCELPVKENYDKSRRKKWGLFQASDMLVNADANGACQIIKKVFPDAFLNGYGIGVVSLTPVVINVAKAA